MNTNRFYFAACLLTLCFWLVCCLSCSCQPAKSVAQTEKVPTAPEPTWPGFGFGSEHQEDSVRTAFARQQQLTHTFGNFFKTADGQWLIVHYRFGIPEGEQYIFAATACPVLDSATFRQSGSYWQDRNGVYYAALTNFSPHVTTVSPVDRATFRSLDFEHLAVDKSHVFQLGKLLPGLQPATLRAYTPNGLTEDWDFNTAAYLRSGNVIYDPDGQRLTATQVAHFRLPAGYKLAYPLPTRKSKNSH